MPFPFQALSAGSTSGGTSQTSLTHSPHFMAENTEARKAKQPAQDQPPIPHGVRTALGPSEPNHIPLLCALSSRGEAGKEKAKTPSCKALEKNPMLHYPSSYLSSFLSLSHISFCSKTSLFSSRITLQSEHKF